MTIVCGIFAILLLIHSTNVTRGYVMNPNVNTEVDGKDTAQDLKEIFDTIFENEENAVNFVDENANNLLCYLKYQIRGIIIDANTSLGVVGCLEQSLDLKHYIRSRSWKRLKKHIRRDIRRCRKQTNDFKTYLECSARVIIYYVRDIENKREIDEEELGICIVAVLLDVPEALEENINLLLNCLEADNSTLHPSQNSTTVSPIITTTIANNSTFNPHKNNTTVSPTLGTTVADNSTFNPSKNSTTVSPILNTTQTYNSTFNPPQNTTTVSPNLNTTQVANSTNNPWQNTTTVSPILNTTQTDNSTLIPWLNTTTVSRNLTTTVADNSTLNPWESSSAVSPDFNTTVTNNSTHIPRKISSTISPVTNKSTESSSSPLDTTTVVSVKNTTEHVEKNSALPWWNKAWESISSIF